LTNADRQPEQSDHLHERRFQGGPDRLRASERMALLEVSRVVALSIEGLTVKSVLDVGTGTGIFAEAFAAMGIEVTGVDVNAELLAVAQQHVPAGQFREAPMEQLPFPDRSFDLVFLGHVLHEADNFLTALQEARRVTRNRVAILEWPYREEPNGPPLEHRLKSAVVEDFATSAGYAQVETSQLQHMDFYRLTR
jgi:ubiquinone/menaquinone biosynthesis C-methylase UbiE